MAPAPSRRPHSPATLPTDSARINAARSNRTGTRVKVLLQRVTRAAVRVDGQITGEIGNGLLLLTGAWTELMGWLRSWLAATGFGESAL